MARDEIRFEDGGAYERYMGVWSREAGKAFLDWLRPPPGLRWLDVGCGNGAFTSMLAARCAPSALAGIDPSEAQLAYARKLPELSRADFRPGDARALPFPADAFDAAVMPLVIFFVPDPPKGVAEMARVVAPGGLACAYAWDMEGGGFPYAAMGREMEAMGIEVRRPPHPQAADLEVLRSLWKSAGLTAVETAVLTARRVFSGFDEYWAVVQGAPSMGPTLASLDADVFARLREAVKARLPASSDGRLVLEARAHAVRGRKPG